MSNRKKSGSTELRLGRAQALLLVSTICASLFLSFYLGLLSGRNKGFEEGRISDISREPRLHIAGDVADRIDDELVARLYAKLDQDPTEQIAQDDIPELGSLAASSGLIDLEVESKVSGIESRQDNYPEETLGALLIEREKSRELAKREAESFDEAALSPEVIVSETLIPEAESAEDRNTISEILITDNVSAEKVVEIESSIEPDGPAVLRSEADPTDYVVAVVPRGWFAQVAAPGDKEDAIGLASMLHQAGFPVLIENARVRGQNYFRVLVGPEETRQLAERLVSQLKRERYLYDDPFIRLVN